MSGHNTHPARKSKNPNRITSGGSVTYSLRKLMQEIADDDGIELDTRQRAEAFIAKIPARKPRGMNKNRRWLPEVK